MRPSHWNVVPGSSHNSNVLVEPSDPGSVALTLLLTCQRRC